MYLADRACDLIFLGQTLTSSEGSSGSYALGNVHREVELDLYENYAAYVIDVINNQLIPSIIELNWGNSEELPFLEVELNRPDKDRQIAERDQILFQKMGLPVSKQWLYDRHKVPAPGPSEDLFNPNRNRNRESREGNTPSSPPASAKDLPTFLSSHLPPSDCVHAASNEARLREDGAPQACPVGVTVAGAPRAQKEQCTAEPCCIEAASESTASLNLRKGAARAAFSQLLADTNLDTHELVWTGGDCPVCSTLNGTTYPDGWATPPPLHHNCDCQISIRKRG